MTEYIVIPAFLTINNVVWQEYTHFVRNYVNDNTVGAIVSTIGS